LAQRPQRESQVAHSVEEPVRATLVAHVVLVSLYAAEIALRSALRLIVRHPSLRVSACLHLEMELDLFFISASWCRRRTNAAAADAIS
jgi:hypothetical protein